MAKKLSKKDLEKLAADNNVNIPSSLTTNAKREEYIRGAISDKQRGFSISPPKYTMNYSDLEFVSIPRYTFEDVNGWLGHLHTHGYSVIQDILAPEIYSSVLSEFWDYLGSCNTDDPIQKDVPESWSYDKVIPSTNGVFKALIGHEKFIWDVRVNTLKVFQRIWNLYGPRDLVTSFDGGSFLIPTKKESFQTWLHFDQHRSRRGFDCVQGVMTLTDSFEEDGGFCFLCPNSGEYGSVEKFFQKFMDDHQSCGLVWGKVDMTDPILRGQKIKKLCVPKNSLILFDSRLLHANVPSRRNPRLAIYTSFQPRSGVNEETAAKRRKALENHQMTGHWCYGHYFGVLPKLPHTYGKPIKYPQRSNIPDFKKYEDII